MVQASNQRASSPKIRTATQAGADESARASALDAPELANGLGWRLWLARLALLWEALWPALWPALGFAGLFVVLALFDILPALPLWAHVAALIVFALAIAAALWRGLRRVRFPDLGLARRRIEIQSRLSHRPLAALRDTLAAGNDDPAAQALWELHQQRARDSIRLLRVGAPAPGLARRDPWALRGGLLLLLVVGLVAAHGDMTPRLVRAMWPTVGASGIPLALDIWITPPSYTGLAPIYLSRGAQTNGAPGNATAPTADTPPSEETVAVPVGSTVLAQVHGGGRKTPVFKLGSTETPFEQVDESAFRLDMPLEDVSDEDKRLSITQGGSELAGWRIRVIPDQEPTVALAGPPARTERAAMRLAYEGADDYGVTSLQAFIRRAGDGAGSNEPIVLDLPISGNAKTPKGSSYHDLTAHPWAGLPVTLQLVAKDAVDQIGVSDAMPMTLPEREFNHPVARAIIELRKMLSLDPRNREAVRNGLGDISERPQSFSNDTIVFLSLRTAVARLRYAGDPEAIDAVQAQLWDTALRIEDGRLSMAERDLRQVQQALQDALSRNADSREIERLMDELQQALNRFLQEAMKNAQQMPQQPMPFDPNARYLTPQDLQRMLDRAREMARSGSPEAAKEMLAMLQEMLENLRSGNMAMSPEQQQQQSQAAEMMRQLQELMRRQRELMEQTYRDAQQGRQQGQQGQQGQQQEQQGQQPGGAEAQEALRRMLGDMMRQLGEMGGQIPDGLGRAERSMRDAGEALGRQQPGQALGPQADALDALQQGAGEMMQQMQQQMGQGPGMGQPGQPGMPQMPRPGDPRGFDPLGRQPPTTGMADDGRGVRIPDESEMMQSREILEELRRRAGEMERPRLELDYIDRLLRRF